ncbi:FtsW/RodA/SpoVE family cell cycle protein [Amycolatopsis mongoliensis]|uniref:FtsW/RodA/SpoVE family cell cycle protein n=1 Tax=Amycolatopsis mongoliensis TaxID=715475 RepID=A0A9Y2NEL0_9PSEU|nr:FtsW/RodA/SpoVE family cell cycle protein [Amycolatopsis sp. 4-36]WIX98798.1 FtsW/RodA/SpoVE family cell cycle protein [Amycolatopsis sp. 4-36]
MPTQRRGAELALTAFAAVLFAAATALVDAAQCHPASVDVVGYGAGFVVVFTGAHTAVRRWAPHADPLILPCVALLNGLGVVMIRRLDLAHAAAGQPTEDASRQALWTVLGAGAFVAVLAAVRDHRRLARFGYTAGLVAVVATAVPALLPSGVSEVNGAKVWIRLGPVSVEPGEFAKILLVVFAAAFLVRKRELFATAGRRIAGVELPRPRDLGPIAIATAACLGMLTFEKELGAALLFFGIILVMVYTATGKAVWIGLGGTLFAGGSVLACTLFTHVRQRVANWIDPLATYDLPGGGYQLAQGLFGLGTGGLTGTGLGAGRPEAVPEASTDFITAAIGEELGLTGLAAVLVVYLLIALRGLRAALTVREPFGKLLAGGLAFALVLQIFVVVGGVTKLIPETGLTAPFLSAGGSSLLANYGLVAVLVRVSDAANRPAAPDAAPVRTPVAEELTRLVRPVVAKLAALPGADALPPPPARPVPAIPGDPLGLGLFRGGPCDLVPSGRPTRVFGTHPGRTP